MTGPIAIIGAGLRFPGGSSTLDSFDEFLRAGRSGIGPLPRDRWDVDAFAPTEGAGPNGSIRAVAGGFLDQIDQFDAAFFNVAPKQAPYLDPQQRILLETAWEALENANVDPATLRHGTGGVYIGSSPVDFPLGLDSLAYDQLDGALATGMGAYSLSGRLSYFLGLRGPSLTTDTACASSLTALHLAVSGLRRGECDIALCGGVNALHHPRTFVILSHGQFLAPDGRCKTFDDSADGYARAEGCGVLVLKRLDDAQRDGDTILAVVRGTAIGQDGESAGLSAPNGVAQERVMRAALADAGLEPADVQYVEAHGTGTPLGDPIEMSSVNAVYGPSHSADEPLYIASLKSNLGHMEPAAGVGGLVKVILQLRNRVIYPHVYSTPSGRIPWDRYRVAVPTRPQPWQAPVRRASINGFGVAGAIGVAVLEEAPSPVDGGRAPEEGGHVFTLSAKSRSALVSQAARLRQHLAQHPDTDLGDLCYTRAVGRSHFKHRLAGVVNTAEDLEAVLTREPADDPMRRVAFMFTGSGAQHVGMGAPLYRQFPAFRGWMDECDELFRPHLGRSIVEVMLGRAADAEAVLARTTGTHAALFTLEYALARLWQSWGVRPTVLIGHSVGEVVAATVAGLFSLPDGVAFLAARAALIESVREPGGMAAVSASRDEVDAALVPWPDLAVAAVNSPRQCVISGARGSLDAATETLRTNGFPVTPVPVTSAFHSPLMAPLAAGLREALDGVAFGEPTISTVSNLTGDVAAPRELATPEYWVRHLVGTVDFAGGVAAIGARGRHVFLEIGPSATLTPLARQCLPAGQHRWVRSLDRRDASGAAVRQAVVDLYLSGATLSWPAFHAGRERRRVDLPTYAFERRRYWLPARAAQPHGAEAGRLLGRPVATDSRAEYQFVSRISAADPAYLADHTLRGRPFLPATAYLELLLELADAVFGDAGVPVADLRMHTALFLSDRPTQLRTSARSGPDGRLHVDITSRPAAEDGATETLHATAIVGGAMAADGPIPRPAGEPRTQLSNEDIYAAYALAGLDYGPQFRRVATVARYGEEVTVGELDATGAAIAEHLPPPLLDGATHGLAALLDADEDVVSTRIDRLRVFKKPRADRLRTVMRRVKADDPEVAFALDVDLLEGDRPVAYLRGMGFKRMQRRPAATPTQQAGPVASEATGVTGLIRTTVAALLSIEDPASIDDTATFLELGVDSLVAVDLAGNLGARLGVSLPSTSVFDHPSVERLADYIESEFTAALRTVHSRR